MDYFLGKKERNMAMLYHGSEKNVWWSREELSRFVSWDGFFWESSTLELLSYCHKLYTGSSFIKHWCVYNSSWWLRSRSFFSMSSVSSHGKWTTFSYIDNNGKFTAYFASQRPLRTNLWRTKCLILRPSWPYSVIFIIYENTDLLI